MAQLHSKAIVLSEKLCTATRLTMAVLQQITAKHLLNKSLEPFCGACHPAQDH